MDKQALIAQLGDRIRKSASVAEQAAIDAEQAAREAATPKEKREDARAALEFGGLARGQGRRMERARADLAALEKFRPGRWPAGAKIGLGAIVEIEEEEGTESRSFLLAPVGAGTELTVPGGDGFLSVVTPSSPIGRAVLGRREGESIEVTVDGDVHYWKVTYVE